MARYVFNIYNGKEIFDPSGVVLSGPEEIQCHMLALATAWVELEDHKHTDWLVKHATKTRTWSDRCALVSNQATPGP